MYIRLTPCTATIERIKNGKRYSFVIDAYQDEEGEIYYKAKDIREIEEKMKQMEEDEKSNKKDSVHTGRYRI